MSDVNKEITKNGGPYEGEEWTVQYNVTGFKNIPTLRHYLLNLIRDRGEGGHASEGILIGFDIWFKEDFPWDVHSTFFGLFDDPGWYPLTCNLVERSIL